MNNETYYRRKDQLMLRSLFCLLATPGLLLIAASANESSYGPRPSPEWRLIKTYENKARMWIEVLPRRGNDKSRVSYLSLTTFPDSKPPFGTPRRVTIDCNKWEQWVYYTSDYKEQKWRPIAPFSLDENMLKLHV